MYIAYENDRKTIIHLYSHRTNCFHYVCIHQWDVYLYFISILRTSDYLLIDTLITLFDYVVRNSACSTHKLGSARRYGI